TAQAQDGHRRHHERAEATPAVHEAVRQAPQESSRGCSPPPQARQDGGGTLDAHPAANAGSGRPRITSIERPIAPLCFVRTFLCASTSSRRKEATMLSRWDPFSEIARLQDQFARWAGPEQGYGTTFSPAIDIF